MGKHPGRGHGAPRRPATIMVAFASLVAVGLVAGGAQAASESTGLSGIKRITAPIDGAIKNFDGFAGHTAAPRNRREQLEQLKRFNHTIVYGPNGAVLRVIVLGPKNVAPPLPRAKPLQVAAAAAAAAGKLPGPGPALLKPGMRPLGLPLSGVAISSGFGMREHPILGGPRPHMGVDLPAPAGTPVRAAADGRVRMRAWKGGYGRFVLLDHGFGLETAYGHLRGYATNLQPGQRVSRGQVIGYVGSSGRSTGPHLHYEVRVNGRAVNPVEYLPATPRRVRVRY